MLKSKFLKKSKKYKVSVKINNFCIPPVRFEPGTFSLSVQCPIHQTMKLDESFGHFSSIYFNMMKNSADIEKNYRFSNTFWLYQHRVKYAQFLCYSHLKKQNFKRNTLYLYTMHLLKKYTVINQSGSAVEKLGKPLFFNSYVDTSLRYLLCII